MKTSFLLTSTASLFLAVASAKAQTLISYVGVTTANQQPGSATDFIDFYSGNYPMNGPSVNQSSLGNGTVTADLNSFTVNGGVRPENSNDNNFSTITTPAGQTFLTGAIVAEPGIAFALTPGVSNGSGGYTLNPNFNYNDFNVYLMFSNTNNSLQNGDGQTSIQSDAVISIDSRGGSTATPFGTNDVAVEDNTNATTVPGGDVGASPSTAQYIEFHITGLGAAIEADPSADLVVSANLPRSGTNYPEESYIGGVSFVSAPEPSTYALMLIGIVALAYIGRIQTQRKA